MPIGVKPAIFASSRAFSSLPAEHSGVPVPSSTSARQLAAENVAIKDKTLQQKTEPAAGFQWSSAITSSSTMQRILKSHSFDAESRTKGRDIEVLLCSVLGPINLPGRAWPTAPQRLQIPTSQTEASAISDKVSQK